MTDNLNILPLLLKFDDDNDDFYFILITDRNLFIPYIIYHHTNINLLISDIKRLCKKSGKAYLFLDKKSLKATMKLLIHQFIEILDHSSFPDFKNTVLELCCTNRNSVRQSKRFLIDYDEYSFRHKMFHRIDINGKRYCVGYIHELDKRYLKYLKRTFNIQENARIIIYSKS